MVRTADVGSYVDQATHLLSPLLITVVKIPPVAYYPSKDVATYLSRSRCRHNVLKTQLAVKVYKV